MDDVVDIRREVLSIVQSYGKLKGPVPCDKDLYGDLGIESVNAISILLALEGRFNRSIDDTQFLEARTLDQLVSLMAASHRQGTQVA